MTKGSLRLGSTDIRLQGDGAVVVEPAEVNDAPSPHRGAVPEETGKMVVCPAGHEIAGSQQSEPGPYVAVPSVMVPPPEEGHAIDGTRLLISQMMLAPVGVAFGVTPGAFCMPNCPSKVAKFQVS